MFLSFMKVTKKGSITWGPWETSNVNSQRTEGIFY